MAIFRQVQTSIWADNWVGMLTPNQKLVWLYLITNSRTRQCGVYEFAMRYAVVDTGLTAEEIESALKKFQADRKLLLSPDNNDEVLIVNWLKYNSARSPKVAAVIDKEIADIKTKAFADAVISECHKLKYPIKTKKAASDTVSIPYLYSTNTVSQPEPEPQPEKEPEPQPEEKPAGAADPGDMTDVYQAWEDVFGRMSPLTMEKLIDWAKDFEHKAIIEAISRADANNKTFAYAEGILRRWDRSGVHTMAQIALDDQKYEAARRQRQNGHHAQQPRTKQPPWAAPDYVPPAPKEASPEVKAHLAEQLARFKKQQEEMSKQ